MPTAGGEHGVEKGGYAATAVPPTTSEHALAATFHVHVPPGRSTDTAPSHVLLVSNSDAHTAAAYALASKGAAKKTSPRSDGRRREEDMVGPLTPTSVEDGSVGATTTDAKPSAICAGESVTKG